MKRKYYRTTWARRRRNMSFVRDYVLGKAAATDGNGGGALPDSLHARVMRMYRGENDTTH